MCLIISVCAKRFSVITMSMKYCNLAVGVIWCFEFKCEVPSFGRNDSTSQSLFCMRTHDQARYRPIVLVVSLA